MSKKVIFSKLTKSQLSVLFNEITLDVEHGYECRNSLGVDPYAVWAFMDKYYEYLFDKVSQSLMDLDIDPLEVNYRGEILKLHTLENFQKYYRSKAWVEVDQYLLP